MNKERWLSLVLVLLQFALCILIVGNVGWSALNDGDFRIRQVTLRDVIACSCIVFGALLGLWSWWAIGITRLRIMPEPGAKTQLITAGPYKKIRHPMYAGLLLMMLGLLILDTTWVNGIAWCCLYIVLDRKAAREEVFLSQFFDEYHSYRQRTGRFFPRA